MIPASAVHNNTNYDVKIEAANYLMNDGVFFIDLDVDNYYDHEENEWVFQFSFFYDIALQMWASPEYYGYNVGSYGGGEPQTYWYYDPMNNITRYPTLDLYNETRFGGWMNVMMDDYQLGISNFAPNALSVVSKQEIEISLANGWHYITIIATEIHTDGDHTEFNYVYLKDQVRFYVGHPEEEPNAEMHLPTEYNTVDFTATAKESMDMGSAFNYSDPLECRILVEPNYDLQTQSVDLGTEEEPIATDVELFYNASSGDPDFFDSAIYWPSGPAMLLVGGKTGPHNVSWVVNDYQDIYFGGSAPLQTGVNYIYGLVWGFQPDGGSVALMYNYATQYVAGIVWNIRVDIAIFTITVGVDEAGPTYGIFISVSILGLVTALFLMRRRRK